MRPCRHRVRARALLAAVTACLLSLGVPAAAAEGSGEGRDLAWLQERVAEAPHDADALYNLARRYAEQDALGVAILQLERAHRAAPRDRGIDDALAIARAEASRRRAEAVGSAVMVEGESPRIARWRFFGGLQVGVYAATLLLGVWLACGALVLARRSAGTRRDLAGWAVGAGVLSALIGAIGWVGATWTAAEVTPGVVVVAEPRWRDAPDDLAPARRSPNLYEGGVVELGETREAWQELLLVDGTRGWVALDEVVPIATSRR